MLGISLTTFKREGYTMNCGKFISNTGSGFELASGITVGSLDAAKLLFMKKLAEIRKTSDELFLGYAIHWTGQAHFKTGRGGDRMPLANFLKEIYMAGHRDWANAYALWCRECLGVKFVFEDRGTKEDPDVFLDFDKTDMKQGTVMNNLFDHITGAVDEGIISHKDNKWLKIRVPKAKAKKKEDKDTSTDSDGASSEQEVVTAAIDQAFDADSVKAAAAAPLLAKLATMAATCPDFKQYMDLLEMSVQAASEIKADKLVDEAVNEAA